MAVTGDSLTVRRMRASGVVIIAAALTTLVTAALAATFAVYSAGALPRVEVAGHDVTALPERERLRLRRETVAFIFQSFGLIPILSAAENVGVPLRIAGRPAGEREERVRLMLDIVGLSPHARQRPAELSGGQQQRVAIARALAGRPDVLLADEPTGQLDSETAKQIMRLLRGVVRSERVTALVATHDPNLIDLADRVLYLEDGQIRAG
jgi:putative ABC transport system ATP-binding protein